MRNRNNEKDNEKMTQEKDRKHKAKERRKEREKNKNLLCSVWAHSHCTSLLSVAECHHSVKLSGV